MAEAVTADELAGVSPEQLPGVTGHVVVVDGVDETGAEAVAVWHASAAGVPVGAWITPRSVLAADPAAAATLLTLTAHRAVFSWDRTESDRVLAALAGWAGLATPPARVTVQLPELLSEVAQWRHTYQTAAAEQQSGSRSKPASLEWRQEVPEADSWAQYVAAVRLPEPQAASPVAARALHLVRALARTVELWQATETVRTRRKQLLERFGPATALPPGWLDQLRQAQALPES
ncbi:MAG TPA: DUF6218 family protein [Natronosporangium sp.]|jgi:hypothetical protein|nr:DUF6218 family protein [Natronosporangium sp.]